MKIKRILFIIPIIIAFTILSSNEVKACAPCERSVCAWYCGSCPGGAICSKNNDGIDNGCGQCRYYYCAPIPNCQVCDNSCNGTCTLSCPSGQTLTNTGPYCVGSTSSCSYQNGCGNWCSRTGGSCYYPETNVAQSIPTSITMTVDGVSYTLSTNPAAPTRIKLPVATSPTATLSIPSRTAPPTSRGLGYNFQANNYGVSNEWATWVGCSGTAGEDFCYEGASNTINFTPTSKTILQVLKENAVGKISGLYYTINKCNDSKVYSLPLEGYYIVDTIPTPPPSPILNIGTDVTSKGCQSTTYTGTEVNNPLTINGTTTDSNNVSEIDSIIVWFSKDSTTATTTTITGTYTNTNTNDIAIMLRKNAGSWASPLVYGLNTNNTWGPVTNSTLLNTSNAAMLRISDISITQSTNLSFSFKLEFLINSTGNPAGIYKTYATVIDTYMINSNIIDQSRITNYSDWGIDLDKPSVSNYQKQVVSTQELDLTWQIADTTSNILNFVINGYKTDGSVNQPISLTTPLGYNPLTLSSIPEDSQIGNLTDTNAWKFTGLSANPYSSTARVNIGQNEGGTISLYITGYDSGCNSIGSNTSIELSPWTATYGGIVYSQDGITTEAKDVSSYTPLDTSIRNVAKENLDTGTELISSRYSSIENLIHPELQAVRAINIYDSNDKKDFWFSELKTRLENESSNLTSFTLKPTDTKVSSSCAGTNCYMYSTNDIDIPSGYQCDKKTLIMSEANINIQPNITNSSTSQGCIFVAKNTININAGVYQSSGYTTVQYDYIEGFLLAEDKIVIADADSAQSIRDGVEIKGGVVAIGRDSSGSEAITINRDLKLFNQTNPLLVVTYDNRFARISEIFFGSESPIYKQEVGFKTF